MNTYLEHTAPVETVGQHYFIRLLCNSRLGERYEAGVVQENVINEARTDPEDRGMLTSIVSECLEAD